MVYALEYEKSEAKLKELDRLIRDAIAFESEEEWNIDRHTKAGELKKFLDKQGQLEVCFAGALDEADLSDAELIRKKYAEAYLLLVADMKMSPMKYLKPSIKPTSLLLEPYSKEEALETIREFLHDFVMSRDNASDEKAYVVENKGKKTILSYSKIHYFEARDKRVYIRSGNTEMSVYETLSEIEEILPEYFIRCHRSFVINKNLIKSVDFSQNEIIMQGDVFVPLSRGCRQSVKEALGK